MSEIYVATWRSGGGRDDGPRQPLEYALASGDAPLTGMRYVVLAWVLLLRGRLDEAEPLLAEARRYLEGNHEPQLQLGLSEVFADAAMRPGR